MMDERTQREIEDLRAKLQAARKEHNHDREVQITLAMQMLLHPTGSWPQHHASA